MPTFYDDFQRANGGLGAAWGNNRDNAAITGGNAVSGGYSFAYATSITSSGRIESVAHVYYNFDALSLWGPAVKLAPGNTNAYVAGIQRTSGVDKFSIFILNTTTFTSLVTAVCSPLPGAYNKISLVWDTGTLTATLNDGQQITTANSVLASSNYAGLAGTGTSSPVADVSIIGGAAAGLTLDPSVIGNYGACVTVTLTGTNTSWTAGTPGAPIFTVNHGTISAQTVVDSTHATLTYCPGSYLGAITFMDPSTLNTAGGIVTSDPSIAPVGGAALSQTAIDYIERSAIAEAGGTIVNREQQINAFAGLQTLTETITTINAQVTDPGIPASGVGSLLGFVIEIFDLINGGNNWGGAATVFGNTSLIKSGVDDANTAISDMRGAGGVTLATLAAALSNLRGVGQPSLADVLSAISTPDLGPISDKLDAMRGDTTTSLYTLLSSLAGLRTVSAYSLGDVMDAIGNLGGSPSAPTAAAVVALVAALALAAPTGGASVAAAAVAVGAGPVLDLATIVELVGVLGELAAIAADVAALAARPAGGYVGAPVWPGASGATLGDAQALSDGLIVTGPLDGLIVAVTGHPAGAGKYAFGSITSWQHCGAVVFESDRGDYERAESFGLASQLIVPRTMAHAASAVVRLNGGWSGTVRKWSATT